VADTLVAGTPRRLLVDGRNPFADETINASGVDVAAPDADGNVFVSAQTDAVDGATGVITVDPGSEDVNRTQGSDDITISVPVVATPLAVTLE
jgi:sugar lactone lactonase YvrE